MKRMRCAILENDPFLCMPGRRAVNPRTCPRSMHILLKRCKHGNGGAVFAVLLRAAASPRMTMQEQARAASTLCPQCSLYVSEKGNLVHRHFPHGPSRQVVKHESFAARALRLAPNGSHTVPFELRRKGDRSLFTGVVYSDGSACDEQDPALCVVSWGLVANTGAGDPVTVLGALPFLIQDVNGAELIGLFMFPRIARATAQYVTDSSCA